MNTRQELIDAMNGENEGVSPPAVFTQSATVSQMDACGASWPDAIYDPCLMERLSLQLSEQFGFATARVPFDVSSEDEAFGCSVDRGRKDRQPAVTGSPWNNGTVDYAPELIPIEDFLTKSRCAVNISAAERIGREHPDLFLTAALNDPFGMACTINGMENFLMGMMMDQDVAESWVKRIVPYQCAYAAELSVHADNLFIITEAEEDILPPDLIDVFITPYITKVISSAKDCFTTVHTCGYTADILEKLASFGETALSVETHDDPEGVMERIGGKVRLAGGIMPVEGMMQGTPGDIITSAKRYSDLGYAVIMPECGVPPQTPDNNLAALSGYRCL